MIFLNTTKELNELNKYLQENKSEYINNLNIQCDKILNKRYKVDNNIEYKRQIILTTSDYIDNKYIIKDIFDKDNELEFKDISNIKDNIIGYITFYTNDNMDQLVDEGIAIIYYEDYNEKLEYFENLIYNINWDN